MSNEVAVRQSGSLMEKDERIVAFKHVLNDNMKALVAAMPNRADEARLCRLAMNACIRNPALLQCNPASFFLAVLNCAELGLEPGIQQQVALIPYKGMIQTQLQYQGLIELVRRSGQVSTIYAECVRESDTFQYEMGLDPKLVHKPNMDADDKDWLFVYAVCHLKDGGKQFVVMNKKQVMAIKGRSAAVRGGASTPWDTDEIEMAKKTVLKRLIKMLPKSVEMARAIEYDSRAEGGEKPTSEALDLTTMKRLEEMEQVASAPEIKKPVPASKSAPAPTQAQEPDDDGGLGPVGHDSSTPPDVIDSPVVNPGPEPTPAEQLAIAWQEMGGTIPTLDNALVQAKFVLEGQTHANISKRLVGVAQKNLGELFKKYGEQK